jgi:hypothetical protein
MVRVLEASRPATTEQVPDERVHVLEEKVILPEVDTFSQDTVPVCNG